MIMLGWILFFKYGTPMVLIPRSDASAYPDMERSVKDIKEVLFPISEKEALDLFVRPRYVRVRQYSTQLKIEGIWSPSTDAWLVVKDCGDSKSYLVQCYSVLLNMAEPIKNCPQCYSFRSFHYYS